MQEFICEDCGISGNTEGLHSLCFEAINYLQVLNTKSPSEVRKEVIQNHTMQQLHDLLFMLISRGVDTKLKSLDAGRGIL